MLIFGAGIVIGCTTLHYDLRNFGMISIIRAANAIPQQNPTAIDLTMSKLRIACECRASRTFRSGGNEKNSGIMMEKISLRDDRIVFCPVDCIVDCIDVILPWSRGGRPPIFAA